MTRVAGIVTSLVPYHHARWQAFAQMSGASCEIVELTNKDEFSVLEFSPVETLRYEKISLFPQRDASRLSPSDICQRISQTLDQLRPTCVCLNGYASPLALGTLSWCLNHQVPAILMSESTAWDDQRQIWKEWVKSRLIRLCASALVGGTPHADYLMKLGMDRNRIFLGYDAVDNDHFDLGSKSAKSRELELRIKHNLPEKYFLACARFTPKKNLPRLVEAYAQYRKRSGVAPWDLVILGDGGGREALSTLCSKFSLEKNVRLIGAKPYNELPIYYGLASAFIHVSTTEQWGLVVNEAMASGLPVLVSHRCGCAEDLVQEGVNGFTFDPYQMADIAQKMLQLTASSAPLLSLGKASREIIAKWSLQRFADGLFQAVKVALSTPPPRSTRLDRLLLSTLMHR